jgi:hypothetical protein
MHEILWNRLDALDGEAVARRAACDYDTNKRRYTIKMLAADYVVDCGKRRILRTATGKDAGFIEQLCILSYLLGGKDGTPSGKLVKAQALPAGQFFFRGLHELPTDKLAKAFGEEPHRLLKAGKSLEGEPRDYGNTAVEIRILPKLPVTFVVWKGDEEFGPRASILFDASAADFMPLDALQAAVSLAVAAITD